MDDKTFFFAFQFRNGFNFGVDIESIHEPMTLTDIEDAGIYDVNGIHFRVGFIEWLIAFIEPMHVDQDE